MPVLDPRNGSEIPSWSRSGRLLARPDAAPTRPNTPGTRPLGLGEGRDGLLVVPALAPANGLPLLVWLHGAGGKAGNVIGLLETQARAAGVALLVPESRGVTWDIILGGYGPDVAFLDVALHQVFAELPLDSKRVAIGGFSDGASYALSLGLANGDLFRWVLAFSPGVAIPPAKQGKPRIYISHGTEDTVLPIARCSRRIVPRLLDAGYEVRYDEFEGGHMVPGKIATEALALLLES